MWRDAAKRRPEPDEVEEMFQHVGDAADRQQAEESRSRALHVERAKVTKAHLELEDVTKEALASSAERREASERLSDLLRRTIDRVKPLDDESE
jgi:hypothetical protein